MVPASSRHPVGPVVEPHRHRLVAAGVDHQVGQDLGRRRRPLAGPDQHPGDAPGRGPADRLLSGPGERRVRRPPADRRTPASTTNPTTSSPARTTTCGDASTSRTAAGRGLASQAGLGTSARSIRVTRSVVRARARAAATPAGPAPTTTAWDPGRQPVGSGPAAVGLGTARLPSARRSAPATDRPSRGACRTGGAAEGRGLRRVSTRAARAGRSSDVGSAVMVTTST